MLFNMEAIHNLDGTRKQFLGDVPDPGRTVADDDRTFGLREAPAGGFAQYTPGELGGDGIGV